MHTDHLGTPRVISDGATKIWRWVSTPFGVNAANEDPDDNSVLFIYNLRFPGQYYDAETGLHYNYFRTYDPSTGRYLESDPIGLAGGLNTYGYVGGDPLSYSDSRGQFRVYARRSYQGQAGQYEWQYWFDFGSKCWVQKVPWPWKPARRINALGNIIFDGLYSGDVDIRDDNARCGCQNYDPDLEDWFTNNRGYSTGGTAPLNAKRFNQEGAEQVLRDLRKEFDRLVDEECDSGCDNLKDAYPWKDLLRLARERALAHPQDLRN